MIIPSVAPSPDGTTLATGSRDETVRLWYLSSDKVQHVLSGDKDDVT